MNSTDNLHRTERQGGAATSRGAPHTVYFQPQDWELLGVLAIRAGASRSEAIRRLIRGASDGGGLALRARIQAVLDDDKP